MTSMHFSRLFSEETKSNTLGDGIRECNFETIPELLTSLGSFFSENSLTPQTTLALQADNSLPGAILLLWLIQNKFRFFLVPPTDNNHSVWENIPAFCSFLIRIEENEVETFSPDSPAWDRILCAEANPRKLTGSNKTLGHPEGMLYVRTSGSMGKSKIVSYTLENLLGNAKNCLTHYGINDQDRMIIPIPIFHLYGFGAAFLPALMGGASIELQKNSHLIKYLSRERKFHPNIAFLTPLLCDMLNKGKRDNTAYRLIVTSGQKIQQSLFKAFDKKFGGCLVNQYGCSEMGAIAASLPTDPSELKAVTMGRIMPGVEVRLQAPQDDRKDEPTPDQAGGLLFVKHPFGYSGYVDEEGNFSLNHEADQWYQTGDWGVADSDGQLRVIDRADNRVNRSGYLVSLSEIDSRISELPQIAEIVVLALEEETQRGRALAAVCVLSKESPELFDNAVDYIEQCCDEILPPYAVPDRIVVVDSIPHLATGKVDRQSLILMVEKKPAE